MRTLDVNVLVDGFRQDSPNHEPVAAWLDSLIGSPESFAVFETVLAGFVRVVTHPRVFDPPTPFEYAIEFVEVMLAQPNCVVLRPGPRHWAIFRDLCGAVDAAGNLVMDAYLAALSIEAGCTFVTSDGDFSRFDGLRRELPEPARS